MADCVLGACNVEEMYVNHSVPSHWLLPWHSLPPKHYANLIWSLQDYYSKLGHRHL